MFSSKAAPPIETLTEPCGMYMAFRGISDPEEDLYWPFNKNLFNFVSKFKKEGNFVTLTGSLFGNKSSMTAYTKLDVIQNFKYEFLASSFGRFMAYYEDKGIFLYSHLEGSIIGTTFDSNIQTVFAKCEVF